MLFILFYIVNVMPPMEISVFEFVAKASVKDFQ